MHPIEHLRYLARARGIDGESFVGEAAIALGSLPADPAMLVVVCRRLIEKHPTVAPLWWLCSGVLVSHDHVTTAWELYERHRADRVLDRVADSVPDGATVAVPGWSESAHAIGARRSDIELVDLGEPATITLIEPAALSAQRLIIATSEADAVRAAAAGSGQLWVVCRLGVRVADAVSNAVVERSEGTLTSIDSAVISHVVADDGVAEASRSRLIPDGPFAPELLRSGVA